MPKPSLFTLQTITESAHIPGISYSYIETREESDNEFVNTSITFGIKSTVAKNKIDNDTQFPASSLSKIVFVYLVLQLVKKGHISLDEPLYDTLQYERFLKNGEYPDKAKHLSARDILSHTTGLPNFGPGSNLSSPLSFADDSVLGEGYSYSGEAFLYLQKVIEKKMSEVLEENIDLEELAQRYVFVPLKMEHSTFLPEPDSNANIVSVHTNLGKPTSVYDSLPNLKYDLELLSSLSTLHESKDAKIYLADNPPKYYVKGMDEPAVIPPEIDLTNLATKLNDLSFKSDILTLTSKAGHTPHLNAAGSLLTTADDFSKFMTAWLKNRDDPIFQQAFEFETSLALSALTPEEFYRLKNDDNIQKFLKNAADNNYKRVPFNPIELVNLQRAINESAQKTTSDLNAHLVFAPTRTYNITKTCGLGWHVYKDADKVIAYQYGENLNTRSFTAINVTDKKGVAFFTNSENGMSIATQLLSSPDLAPIGNMQELFKHMPHYTQSNEPGWKETFEGMLAEDQGDSEKARRCFAAAIVSAPNDQSKQRRLEWFDLVRQSIAEEKKFQLPLEAFEGVYTNPFSEKREIYSKDSILLCKEFDREIILVRVSETDFLPEKNQDFKICIKEDQMTIQFINSDSKYLFEQSLPESQEFSAFFAAISKMSGHQPVQEIQEIANLESSRDLTQRFRKAVGDIFIQDVEPSAEEETVTKNL